MHGIHARNAMKKAGIEKAGVDYWIDCLNNPAQLIKYFESGTHLDHSINWYNPKIMWIVKVSSMPNEERMYFYLAILEKLIPNPDEMLGWIEMRARLSEIIDEIDFVQESDRRLPTNKSFLTALEQRSPMTLEAWSQSFRQGELFALLASNIKLLGLANPRLAVRYQALLDRLLNAMPEMDIKTSWDNGLFIFTSHSRFGPEHVRQAAMNLKKRLFAVRHHLTKDAHTRNIIPLMMLKTLKAGNVVHAAVDYGPGSFKLEGSIFGFKIVLPDSSAWAAWKSNCRCQWRFLVANRKTYGTTPVVNDFNLPDINTVNYEEFSAAFVSNICQNIETAMVEHPFSFGPYKDVWRHLVTTQ